MIVDKLKWLNATYWRGTAAARPNWLSFCNSIFVSKDIGFKEQGWIFIRALFIVVEPLMSATP